jgi:Domain of unknown function (DUF4082)
MTINYIQNTKGLATTPPRLVNHPLSLSIWFSIALVCSLMSLSTPGIAAVSLKAFACAQGFGASAKGGRGGDVYHVTKLTDDRSVGTLRYGIESAKGARTIVFDLGGIINLKKPLSVRGSNLTIAGQTAPGGGITLAGSRFGIINTSNVIVRYMRFRVGDFNARYGIWGEPDKGPIIGNGNKHLYGSAADAITVYNSNHIIIDHVSASWSLDEVVDISDSNNVTLQHAIVSEGLYDSFHPNGVHSMGLRVVGGGKGGITIYNSLLAHNNWRNPLIGGNGSTIEVDFTNNVVYNWGEYSGHSTTPKSKLNYVNNYLIAGPDTTSRNLNTAFLESASYEGKFLIYQAGNYMDTNKNRIHDGKPVGKEAFSKFESNEYLTKALPWPKIDSIFSANKAYQNILVNAGASLVRDKIDRRIINEVRNRTGGFIDSQNDVGGLSYIARGSTSTDSDGDGMPDNWEKANGLNPKNAKDRNKTNLSKAGYTNLEVYLDSIVAAAGQCKTGSKIAKAAIIPVNTVNSDNSAGNIKKKPSQSSTKISIWDTLDTPVNSNENDSNAVELGVKFLSDKDGFIEAIRFYKSKNNTGTHIGNLWTSSGQLLASATFTSETSSGWQQVNFGKPVAIKKDTVYVASYFAPKGNYADDDYFFKRSGVNNANLYLLQSGVSGNNGVYAYGGQSSFPSSSWLHTNYWVDVVFSN